MRTLYENILERMSTKLCPIFSARFDPRSYHYSTRRLSPSVTIQVTESIIMMTNNDSNDEEQERRVTAVWTNVFILLLCSEY